MKLGVYIGSFNPPHIGHIDIVNYLLNGFVDKVLIVPTNGYWNKQDLVDIKHRIAMLKFFESTDVIIDSVNNNYVYTYELMRALSIQYSYDLYLIIGADNIINFDKWKNYRELLGYKIIVMNRDNIDIFKYILKYDLGNFIIVNDYPFIDVSSTYIRNNLDSLLIDKRVLKYIKDNNLYR